MVNKKVPFGIRFKGHWNYTQCEMYNYIDCASSIVEDDLRERYIAFLKFFTDGKCKPSTMVDSDVLVTFYQDVDNRADIDYREGHIDPEDEPELYKGGKYFHEVSIKLKRHLDSLGLAY